MISEKVAGMVPGSLISFYRSNFKYPKQIRNWLESGKPSPPPHIIKQRIIAHYNKISGYKTLVETGTYLGDMVEAQRKVFGTIYSVELAEQLYQQAVKRFKAYNHIKLLQGDSGEVLTKIVPELNSPAIFWLDGHYSGGNTAKILDTPIVAELKTITEIGKQKHIILIDDARCFTGENDYPRLEDLKQFVAQNMPDYTFNVEDDIIRLVPGTITDSKVKYI